MTGVTRRGFIGGLEGALAAAFLKLDNPSLNGASESDRIKLAAELNRHLVNLNQLVGIELPGDYKTDPHSRKFSEYLNKHWGEFVHMLDTFLEYEPEKQQVYHKASEKRSIWRVPLWVRNELKELGIQFTDYPEQTEHRPRTQEQVQEILKYYI